MRRLFIVFILGSVYLLACGSRSDPTPSAVWTPLPSAVGTPLPTVTPQVLISTPIAVSSNCFNDAIFLEDLTIPDQTIVDPGASLDKRWSVQNSGTCDWGPGYRLQHVSNDAFGGTDDIALYPASAGSIAIWQVELNAPLNAGEHISIWQASSPEGDLFGEQVFLWVVVATPTPAPTSRGTPTN